MEKLSEVPSNTITGKDLDYLSDMFEWNYNAFKSTYNDISNITDKELKDFFDKCCEVFDTNMNLVICSINNPGGDIYE